MLDVITHLRSQFGGEMIRPLSALAPVKSICTAFSDLDNLLGIGGIPCGHITTFTGGATSGATTLAHKISAGVQHFGRTTAYINIEHMIDPDYAARCGLRLSEWLLLRPENTDQAHQMIADLLTDTPPALLVIVGEAPLPPALRSILRHTDCALLQVTSRTAGADVALHFEQTGWLYDGDNIRGYTSRVTVTRNRFAPTGPDAMLDITFDDLVDGDAT